MNSDSTDNMNNQSTVV